MGTPFWGTKPLPRVRKPNFHSDRGQDSNSYAWKPLGPQSTHSSTVSRALHECTYDCRSAVEKRPTLTTEKPGFQICLPVLSEILLSLHTGNFKFRLIEPMYPVLQLGQ
ncbi:hypothetical protein E2C01_073440 [Portunus trituberculatus]|uniref:Uncharacterized protein n=1 Tax=Portunus trituberculatus TaxID=210409 RepID=A0A5B7I5D0_PORTR|nr:hypothetical protein [Portunus trituberculatus]